MSPDLLGLIQQPFSLDGDNGDLVEHIGVGVWGDHAQPQGRGRLHRKATLKSGRLHFRQRALSEGREICLLVDPHATVCKIFPKAQQREFGEFLTGLTQRHGLRFKTIESNPCGGWGVQLHEQWLRQLASQGRTQGVHLLLISDWHGRDQWTGPLKTLASRWTTSWLVLDHPLPNFAGPLACEDPNDLDRPKWFDPASFAREHSAWKRRRDHALRQVGPRVAHWDGEDLTSLARVTLGLLGN